MLRLAHSGFNSTQVSLAEISDMRRRCVWKSVEIILMHWASSIRQRPLTVLGTGRIAREIFKNSHWVSPTVLEGSIETSCSRSGKHEGNYEKWREAAVKRLQGQSGWEALNHRHKSCSANELKICLCEERRSGPSAPCVNLNNLQHHRDLDFDVRVSGGIAVTSDSGTDLTYALMKLRKRNESLY